MDLTDICRTYNTKAAEYTFSEIGNRTFHMIHHTTVHNIRLSKFKIQIIPCIFSRHSDVKLVINNRRKARELTDKWKLSNMLLNSQWAKEEIKRGIKKYIERKESGNTPYQNVWDATNVVPRGKFCGNKHPP